MQEVQKFNKNEVERELKEDEKNVVVNCWSYDIVQLLADKELLMNLINTAHDTQSSYIEGKVTLQKWQSSLRPTGG